MPSRESDAPLSNEEYSRLRERFHAPEENYTSLRGDKQAVRGQSSVWDTDTVLEKYVSGTDKVIGLMDGSITDREITDPVNPDKSREKPDEVIFLDKSARPVSWFTDALWDQFAKEGAEKPAYEFLNIDRTNWFVNMGYEKVDAERRLGRADFDIDKVKPEQIARIRALFVEGDLDRDNWEEQVWTMPTRLDDKNVLILDEVMNKGATLAIAVQVLKKALPETTFSGDYFWRGGRYALGGNANELQMESAPVWYDANDAFGRGIGDVSQDYYEHIDDLEKSNESFKRRLGWAALSAPHHKRSTFELVEDKKAMRLQQDIAYLSYDIADGHVLRVPDRERPMNEHVKILKDQGLTPRGRAQYSARHESDVGPRPSGRAA